MNPGRGLRALLEPVSSVPLLLTLLLFWVLGCVGIALLHLFTSSEAGTFLLGLLGALFVAGILLPAVLGWRRGGVIGRGESGRGWGGGTGRGEAGG